MLSTGAAVERWDVHGPYDEILLLSQPAWPARVPLLDSHGRESVDRQLGSVDTLRVVGGDLLGRATLSRHNPRSQRIAAELVGRCHLRHLHRLWRRALVRAHQCEDRPPREGGRALHPDRGQPRRCPRRPACRHQEPRHDGQHRAGARARSFHPGPPAPSLNPPAATERTAINMEIRSIASVAGLDQGWIDSQIDANATTDAARTAAFAAMQARSAPLQTFHPTVATVTQDHTDPTAIRSAMGEALAHRLAPRPGEAGGPLARLCRLPHAGHDRRPRPGARRAP
ncbi:hypothetical protein ACFSKM_21310 [Ancylobacter dichloromethanicus]